MRFKLTPVAVSLCVFGLISTPVFSATQNLDKLAAQVAQLQQQIAVLQAQQGRAAHQNKKTTTKAITTAAPQKKTGTPPAMPGASAAIDDSDRTTRPISGVSNLPTSGTTYLPVDLDVPGQSFVSSGPYIGIPLQYSGSNLIINAPSVNQDVALLAVRKNIHKRLTALGVVEEDEHAHVLLSGTVEGQAMYKDIGGGPNSTDIDVTNATLDAYILGPSQWLSSLFSMSYDNSIGAQEGSLASNSRALNSRMFLNQAFITIGNFTKTAFYGTMGQVYVPFGTYANNMVSSPLTKIMARTKERAVTVGYQPQVDDAFYGSLYAFKGDTHAGATSRVNNGGINLGYHFTEGKYHGDIGGGWIGNIADSIGMQAVANNSTTFNGFGGTNGTGNERIAHRVPAYDARAIFALGDHIDLLAEYITASTSFNKNDMTMNNNGAKPQALDTQAAYTFMLFDRPTSVAIGYDMTKDALALELPYKRYSLVFNTSVWRDTLQSLEFRRDYNYGASNVATGSGISAPTASGKQDSAVTFQFDVYF
ncbi:MAG: LbtU family siderophore porin [Gammaproteobacteria bacterium]